MNGDDFYFYVLLPFVKRYKFARTAARKIGISKSYLSRILSGKRQANRTVAAYFGYRIPNRKGERIFIDLPRAG